MTSSIYRNAFSPKGERVQGRADVGHTYEAMKSEADKYIRDTNRNNLSKRQKKIREKRNLAILNHVNTTESAKALTKFVDSNGVVTLVNVKRRFNPTREELQERKEKGLAVLSAAKPAKKLKLIAVRNVQVVSA